AGGLYGWGILLVIHLEFQGNKASTVFYDTAYCKRLCHGMRLLYLHSAVKIQPFYPFFLLTEYRAKAFCRLILWNFEGKTLTNLDSVVIYI
ncbi:hypothetical protein, partial [Bilophila sp.]|uniref:hypothetical protein n=1 Tax=Bilophila sp. TaxID=1929485 RepID=UPI003076D475